MAKQKSLWVAFNRGIVSVLGRARIDVERITFAAAEMVNWMPRVLGSMTVRPGMGHIDGTKSNKQARLFSFLFSVDDTAQIEMTDTTIRVRVDDVLITRPAVTATVLDPNFTDATLANWTDADDVGTFSAHEVANQLSLMGDGDNSARRRQEVTVTEQTTSHALRIVVSRGTLALKIGTIAGDDDIFDETALGEGTHSIAFVPNAASFFIELAAKREFKTLIDSCTMEAAGNLELPSPYQTADLRDIRYNQSGDVVYLTGGDIIQKKIERRDNDSWSIVDYLPENGPFRVEYTGKTTLTPDLLVGDITITASQDVFKATNVGGLFRVASIGQTVAKEINSDNVFTEPVRISGIGEGRRFSIAVSGNAILGPPDNTVTMQQSPGVPGLWTDMPSPGPFVGTDYANTFLDAADNQIIYYRIGVKTGHLPTPGTISVSLTYAYGSINGVFRVTGFTDTKTVSAIVLSPMGSLTASNEWWEGQWSTRRGFPDAVTLYESRTWWADKDKINGSESDGYESFNDQTEGDSGPISRTIGSGPVRTVHWLAPLGRLLIGTSRNSANVQAVEINANSMLAGRSNSFDEPLTPSNFNMKTINSKAVFVDRSTWRLYELAIAGSDGSYDEYSSKDMSLLTPNLNSSGIVHIAAQQKPDVRIHCIRNDGTVSILIFDRAEQVEAWIEIETDGLVEDISVLPGFEEDIVYYIVNRDGVRSIERWAFESEAQGYAINKMGDSFIHYSGAAITNITGLDHLNGKKVVVWADGVDVSEYAVDARWGTETHAGPTVSGGSITLSTAASEVNVGLSYQARYRSNTISAIQAMHPGEMRRIEQFAMSLWRTHHKGVKYGPDFDSLADLPQVLGGRDVADHEIFGQFDETSDKFFPFGGRWSADSRLCIQGNAPRPATVLGCNTLVDTHEK